MLRCRWLYHLAHRLKADRRDEAAPSPLRTCVHHRHHRGPPAERLSCVAYVAQMTVALTPHLVDDFKPPL
jgi:hypothetical protein